MKGIVVGAIICSSQIVSRTSRAERDSRNLHPESYKYMRFENHFQIITI